MHKNHVSWNDIAWYKNEGKMELLIEYSVTKLGRLLNDKSCSIHDILGIEDNKKRNFILNFSFDFEKILMSSDISAKELISYSAEKLFLMRKRFLDLGLTPQIKFSLFEPTPLQACLQEGFVDFEPTMKID